ncbi:MAG: hypothetical protein GX219_10265 [Tissierellia bacterium]|nr:hypothetical protein [Tissierellia bacterium]
MKKLVVVILTILMILGSSSVFAEDLDLIHRYDASKNYSFNEFVSSDKVFEFVGNNLPDYVIEFSGSYYNASDIDTYINNNPKNAAFIHAVNNSPTVPKPTPGGSSDELTVVEIY